MSVLDQLYRDLDFANGDLMSATDRPCRKRSDWLEKGEWLAAAKRAGAEKVFFVNNNPIAVFSECEDAPLERVRAFNRAWCLARPRLLFLASPGELTVYDLARKPIDEDNEAEWKKLKHLDRLNDIANIATRLQDFHRDHLESGSLFEDKRFGDLKNRADKALIRDLKTVRHELIQAGLSDDEARFAHALIGRSIFIRYLEDRGVLIEDYFRNVAGMTAGWTEFLNNPTGRGGIDFSRKETFYSRVLANKDFTYALFRKLAKDFNGDMFPDVADEEKTVTQQHLTILQGLLFGDVGAQRKLFFHSYRFDIIPLDLISSIYEEFYHSSTKAAERRRRTRQSGAYYTPSVLAEFVLARVLTESVLKKNPRVLDPACGSGVFLVEAFRRIVRHKWHKDRRPPTFAELRAILKDQVAGIEVNPEAAKIAAFSLYLAMLHYLDPPAITDQIKEGNKLPNLVASTSRSTNHFHCILPKNAFDTCTIESNALWRDRFGPGCVDVVVGNPPWGAPGTRADLETKERHRVMLEWCEDKKRPIGDKEPSQAFIWRALDLLKPNGKTGMLVSAGVLFKHGLKTQEFRTQWLESVQLNEVFNFAYVRKFFFKGVNAPFLMIAFRKAKQADVPVFHWVARQTSVSKNTQAVILTKHDYSVLRQEPLCDYSLWKALYAGRYSDRALLKILARNTALSLFVDRKSSGQGFKIVSGEKSASKLKKFERIKKSSFSRYDPLSFTSAPSRVHRLGVLEIYSGKRLLVQRGIDEQSQNKGQIVARYETKPFCFTNAINGLKLSSGEEWKYKTLLGILWSSLARYVFFLTSSNWGLWHHEIHLDDELLGLPVVLDQEDLATQKVVAIVDKLRSPCLKKSIVFAGLETKRREWEQQLDEAVFELYGLNEEQKDLIRDCCDVTLPFSYKPFDSIGATLAVDGSDCSWMEQYARIFCRRWQPYLGDDEEMRAELHLGAHGNMVAAEFYPADKNDPWDMVPKDDWGYVLEQLGEALPTPMGTSQILLDGMVHVVSDRGIIIIKRNQKRLWTRSLAREDADSTLTKQMFQTMPQKGDRG